MAHPWEIADCDVTAEMVATLLAEAAPGRRFTGIAYLAEGWDSRAFSARDESGQPWIFRFPKRKDVDIRLAREIAMLPALAERLPLAIPEFGVVGEASTRYPHRFAGYHQLPGEPAALQPGLHLDPAKTGAALGAFLAALHTTDPAIAGALPLEPDDAGDNEERASTARKQLAEYGGSLPTRAMERASAMLGRLPPAAEERVLVHNDLFPEHILTDGQRITGVIDWGDLAVADAAGDLAGAFYWQGEQLLQATLSTYARIRHLPGTTCERMAHRARFIATCRAAEDLEYGTLSGRTEYAAIARRHLMRIG
jgi:aminoglycoside phosphotransferase (APT) family kinase protein